MASTPLVSSEVLAWARRQVALSEEAAAEKLKVTVRDLAAWERGQRAPKLTDLKRMADVYRRPLAFFFLPAPPEEESLPEDFRTRTVAGAQPEMTSELISAIKQAEEWREVVEAITDGDDDFEPPRRLPRVQRDSPEDVGRLMRRLTGISTDDQLRWKDAKEAFEHWRSAIEGLGLLVFIVRLKVEVCRGFSLSSARGRNVIAIASEEKSYQARSFTLFHELAHLMLGGEAICAELADSSSRGRVERFCNQAAAAALMPQGLVEKIADDYAPGRDWWAFLSVKEAAGELHVSAPALALRLEELGLAPEGQYQAVVAELALQPAFTPRKGGGGQWPGTRISERGITFSSVVYEAWRTKKLSLGDAASLMSMPAKYVSAIGHSLARRV